MARAVVTGLGAVSPVGCGVAKFWASLCAGRSGLAPITRFDAAPFRNNMAGEVKDFDSFPHKPRDEGLCRANAYATAACREALVDAGFERGYPDPSRVGLVLGTNFGALNDLGDCFGGNTESLWRYSFQSTVDLLARECGVQGPTLMLSLSCASGVAAIGCAMDLIRAGRADVVVACGFDELTCFAYTGLNALRTITTDTIRPFDKRRAGTLFAEGAGALAVESFDHARTRSASPCAELLGYATNNDACHMTAPDRSGRGIIAVMQSALADAAVPPDRIDHINAHGTGTQYNDKIETAAIKTVFAQRAGLVPVVSLKGAMGHTMGAAGALETIAAILTLRDGIIPPTLGLQTPDPECDLDYVPGQARRAAVKTVLSNSYGIGGANAAVILTSV